MGIVATESRSVTISSRVAPDQLGSVSCRFTVVDRPRVGRVQQLNADHHCPKTDSESACHCLSALGQAVPNIAGRGTTNSMALVCFLLMKDLMSKTGTGSVCGACPRFRHRLYPQPQIRRPLFDDVLSTDNPEETKSTTSLRTPQQCHLGQPGQSFPKIPKLE